MLSRIPIDKRNRISQELRTRTKSDTAIALIHGVSQPFVSAIRKKLEIPALTRKALFESSLKVDHVKYGITNDKRNLIIALVRRGNFNDRRIARRVGVSPDTVQIERKTRYSTI